MIKRHYSEPEDILDALQDARSEAQELYDCLISARDTRQNLINKRIRELMQVGQPDAITAASELVKDTAFIAQLDFESMADAMKKMDELIDAANEELAEEDYLDDEAIYREYVRSAM